MSWFDNSPSPRELYTNILLEEQIRDNLATRSAFGWRLRLTLEALEALQRQARRFLFRVWMPPPLPLRQWHYDQQWYPAFHAWSRRHGLYLITHPWTPEGADFIDECFADAYLIVAGPAARGFDHCCVYRGTELVHDPHPDRTGLTRKNDWSLLALSDPAKLNAFRAWARLEGTDGDVCGLRALGARS